MTMIKHMISLRRLFYNAKNNCLRLKAILFYQKIIDWVKKYIKHYLLTKYKNKNKK